MKHSWKLAVIGVAAVCAVAALYFGAADLVRAGVGAPPASASKVTFRWVYQPNGSQNLATGVSSGFTTLGPSQGLIFSTQTITGTVADVYYGDPTCGCGETGPGFWANNGFGGVHDLGPVDFAGVTTAPNKTLGVGAGQYYNTQETLVKVGHVYVLVTKDGYDYAKLIVDSISLASTLYPKGDVNCSGTVTSVDSLLILRHNAGLSVSLPAGCPPLG